MPRFELLGAESFGDGERWTVRFKIIANNLIPADIKVTNISL